MVLTMILDMVSYTKHIVTPITMLAMANDPAVAWQTGMQTYHRSPSGPGLTPKLANLPTAKL